MNNNSPVVYKERPCPCGRQCLNHGPSWETSKDETKTTKPGRDVPLAVAVFLIGVFLLVPIFTRLEEANDRLRLVVGKVSDEVHRISEIDSGIADVRESRERDLGSYNLSDKTENEVRRYLAAHSTYSLDEYIRGLSEEHLLLSEKEQLQLSFFENAGRKVGQAKAEVRRLEKKEDTLLVVLSVFLLVFFRTRFLRGYVPWKWHCRCPMKVSITKSLHHVINTCMQCGRTEERRWTKATTESLCSCCGYTVAH